MLFVLTVQLHVLLPKDTKLYIHDGSNKILVRIGKNIMAQNCIQKVEYDE